jgi:hypothetical protein
VIKRDFDFSQTVASIRGKMVQNCGLEMPITTLQCFTLCHVYDTWYGTSDSQFIAQCLWPVMVAHSRKKGIGVVGKTDEDDPQEEGAWATWAKDEGAPIILILWILQANDRTSACRILYPPDRYPTIRILESTCLAPIIDLCPSRRFTMSESPMGSSNSKGLVPSMPSTQTTTR